MSTINYSSKALRRTIALGNVQVLSYQPQMLIKEKYELSLHRLCKSTIYLVKNCAKQFETENYKTSQLPTFNVSNVKFKKLLIHT